MYISCYLLLYVSPLRDQLFARLLPPENLEEWLEEKRRAKDLLQDRGIDMGYAGYVDAY